MPTTNIEEVEARTSARVKVAMITAASGILVAIISGTCSVQTSRYVQGIEFGIPGSLETGQKLCRVLQGQTWRDGLIVPQNWTISLCEDYMKKTGGDAYQLGCIYGSGTNLGKEDGTLPFPNCGWQ